MHEILRSLRSGETVLDLGSKSGSFPASATPATTVRVDLSPAPDTDAAVVRADAAKLPFRDHSFAAVISNHSLEHFTQLEEALREVGRILRKDGSLFVAVPDATTVTDRIYRWLGRGGGHVNPFRSREHLIQQVENATGLAYAGGRVLCSSLSFLNRHNHTERAPRKLLLLGGGNERILRWLNHALRTCDQKFGTRGCVYGWALYFGSASGPVDATTWVNVCVRCGAAHDSGKLRNGGDVYKRAWLRYYGCPRCGAANLFYSDADFQGLR